MAASSEKQLTTFLARYSDSVQADFRAVRERLRGRFPQGWELVYDNYNALVVGYAPTEKASQAIISIAAYPRWVTLFFLKGAMLDDPAHRLQGKGSTVRSVRIAPLSTLDEPEVQDLLQRAIDPYQPDFAQAPALKTVIKSISPKQRSRTPAVRA